jgi:ADP-ribose pyrophosphatase YjhB (NUDIX family)
MTIPLWLDWAQRLQAVAQSGLNYQPQPFDRLRYEQVLAIAAEMMAAGMNADPTEIQAIFEAQAGHATPKVDVRGAVFRGDNVLMVRELLDGGRWTLPGGWADIGESAGESVVREIYEETGYSARAVRLMAAFDRNKHDHPPFAFHAYKLFFLCELTDDERHPDPNNVETGEIGWFSEDDIEGLEVSQGRVTKAQIGLFFRHNRDADLATAFD